jgi:hypothetical protein
LRAKQRILDERFGGCEQRFQHFVRHDRECRRTILQTAGLEAGDAEIADFRPRYYGQPDFLLRLAADRYAIVELCFDLSMRHAFKDFAYVLDPASVNVVAIVWVCDHVSESVVDMIRHYAGQFRLDRRITLEILVPQSHRFDGEPPLRFSFDAQLRDLRAGAPPSCRDGLTVRERLIELFRISNEIDTVALSRLLGTSTTFVTTHAAKASRRHSPRLACKRAPNGTPLRGDETSLLFDLEDVSTFISSLEILVAQIERRHLAGATLPLVCARDARIGTSWLTLEAFRKETSTKQFAAIKRQLGVPVAFCISSTPRGYSLLWPVERKGALRPRAA